MYDTNDQTIPAAGNSPRGKEYPGRKGLEYQDKDLFRQHTQAVQLAQVHVLTSIGKHMRLFFSRFSGSMMPKPISGLSHKDFWIGKNPN